MHRYRVNLIIKQLKSKFYTFNEFIGDRVINNGVFVKQLSFRSFRRRIAVFYNKPRERIIYTCLGPLSRWLFLRGADKFPGVPRF